MLIYISNIKYLTMNFITEGTREYVYSSMVLQTFTKQQTCSLLTIT